MLGKRACTRAFLVLRPGRDLRVRLGRFTSEVVDELNAMVDVIRSCAAPGSGDLVCDLWMIDQFQLTYSTLAKFMKNVLLPTDLLLKTENSKAFIYLKVRAIIFFWKMNFVGSKILFMNFARVLYFLGPTWLGFRAGNLYAPVESLYIDVIDPFNLAINGGDDNNGVSCILHRRERVEEWIDWYRVLQLGLL